MSASPSLTEFTLYFLRLGAIGFDGPIALPGDMQRDLVEDRRWVSSEEHKEGWHWRSWRSRERGSITRELTT